MLAEVLATIDPTLRGAELEGAFAAVCSFAHGMVTLVVAGHLPPGGMASGIDALLSLARSVAAE